MHRITQYIDWTKLINEHQGNWVALADDEVTVVSVGGTPQIAKKAAQENGVKEPYLLKVPVKVTAFAG